MNLFILEAAEKTAINAAQATSDLCDAIPVEITNVTSMVFTAIKIGVPLILVFIGMFDFGKAVMAGKEDEIKGHQKLFIKRLISAFLVFLVLAIVQFFLGLVTGDDDSILTCIQKIVGVGE